MERRRRRALWHRTVVRLRQGVAATQGLSESGPPQGRSAQLPEGRRVPAARARPLPRRAARPTDPKARRRPPPELAHDRAARPPSSAASCGPRRSGRRRAFCARGASPGQHHSTSPPRRRGRRVSAYLAKYATKSTDGSVAFARRFRTAEPDRALERCTTTPGSWRSTAWDLGGREELGEDRLRATPTRSGSRASSSPSPRASRPRSGRCAEPGPPTWRGSTSPTSIVLGAYRYAGRGYSDPRGETVAELLHAATVELHHEARERRVEALRESRDDSRDGSRDRSHGSRDRSRADAATDAGSPVIARPGTIGMDDSGNSRVLAVPMTTRTDALELLTLELEPRSSSPSGRRALRRFALAGHRRRRRDARSRPRPPLPRGEHVAGPGRARGHARGRSWCSRRRTRTPPSARSWRFDRPSAGSSAASTGRGGATDDELAEIVAFAWEAICDAPPEARATSTARRVPDEGPARERRSAPASDPERPGRRARRPRPGRPDSARPIPPSVPSRCSSVRVDGWACSPSRTRS